jgi:hypothetical protein
MLFIVVDPKLIGLLDPDTSSLFIEDLKKFKKKIKYF